MGPYLHMARPGRARLTPRGAYWVTRLHTSLDTFTNPPKIPSSSWEHLIMKFTTKKSVICWWVRRWRLLIQPHALPNWRLTDYCAQLCLRIRTIRNHWSSKNQRMVGSISKDCRASWSTTSPNWNASRPSVSVIGHMPPPTWMSIPLGLTPYSASLLKWFTVSSKIEKYSK